jgi:hypothetical protein
MNNEEIVLQRRRLLRGGALLAGAAAGAVAVSAVGATKAEAADGDQVTVGADHTGTDATTFAIDNQQVPTLGLANDNGPSLRLSPLPDSWEGALDAGEIANTYAGPLIGVSDGPGSSPVTTFLATGLDLAAMPVPVPFDVPGRILDTRSAAGRARVLQTSTSPYTTGARLTAGAWLDVAVDTAEADFSLEGAFLNVTSIDSLGAGFLATYRPGSRPQVATTRFPARVTATSSAFMALGVVKDAFAIRVYTSASTHVIIDVTGVTVTGMPGPSAPAQLKRQPVRRGSAAVKPQRLARRRTVR